MWIIKFLSGPKAGQEVLLQEGLVLLGRESSCQISLPSKGISKKHAQITVKGKQVEIEDLNSSNGIFYKGKKIKTQKLKEGDRVVLNDIVFELIYKNTQDQLHPYFYPHSQPPSYAQNEHIKPTIEPKKDLNFQNIEKSIKGYIHGVLLPGVYKLAEWLEFKWVVGFFLIGFIFLVMILSAIPMTQILKSSVEQESKNHSESIAVTLAKLNRKHLKSGLHTALTVAYAQQRPGVKKAYIIDAINGSILAPSELAHTYPKSSFIHKARTRDQKTVQKIESSTVGAVVPIRFYNPETGENKPVAYSVVLYDMGTLAFGGTQVLSLMIQNLFIACILGLIAFFFLINLIEFPIKTINRQLNDALKNNSSSAIAVSYQSSILNELCNHINSALNQISLNQMLNSNPSTKSEIEQNLPESNRQSEMDNLVHIVGYPCLAIDLSDDSIASLSKTFIDQLGYDDIVHKPLSDMVYTDLKEHLQTLIEQGKNNPEEISFGEVIIKNMNIQTTCQIIMGSKGPAYAIVAFTTADEENEEGAA